MREFSDDREPVPDPQHDGPRFGRLLVVLLLAVLLVGGITFASEAYFS